LTSLKDLSGSDINGNLALVRLESNTSELTDLSVDEDLLMGDAAEGRRGGVEELDTVLRGLLLQELVHAGHVVALGVDVQLQVRRIFTCMDLQNPPRWELHKRDSWEHVLLGRQYGGKDKNVSSREECELLNTICGDRSSVAIQVLQELHGGQLVHSDVCLEVFFLFVVFGVFGTFFGLLFNLLFSDLSDEATVVTPLIRISIFANKLLKLSQLFMSLEVPDSIGQIITRLIDQQVSLTR